MKQYLMSSPYKFAHIHSTGSRNIGEQTFVQNIAILIIQVKFNVEFTRSSGSEFFYNIIQQKRVLDTGQIFPPTHIWKNRPAFHRKFYGVKSRFLKTKSDF